MARPANLANLNIAELQRVINAKRSELEKLQRQRNDLQKRMNQIDRQIERIGGGAAGGMNGSRRGAGGGGGGRARNTHSLVESIEAVLKSAGKPMKVAEIMDGVLASGYRSGSASFRGIVNQTLIKERKRFGNAGRGVYELKSSGGSKKTTKSAA